MRYVCPLTSVRLLTALIFSILLPSVMLGQSTDAGASPKLSITNYQVISEQHITASKSDVTYRADIVNSGPSLTSVTATVTSADPSMIRVVQGQDVLLFGAVPINGQVSSLNTFTILIDR